MQQTALENGAIKSLFGRERSCWLRKLHQRNALALLGRPAGTLAAQAKGILPAKMY
jgi:hypothetical protein